jgi:class 3 adenylate cyclase/tetratricopeptide (TPR) repeat protein
MSSLHTYLPQDRQRALNRGESLPDRTSGAALFADISGFTSLTETLTQELGPRRGIEELTRQVNSVYDALITEIETYNGSVISFAGDAITCWFDGDRTGQRAVTSALALQVAMSAFPKLGLKVAVTSGPARRFIVGDPTIQLLDALAGATVSRLATAEHIAARGEVLMDVSTANALAGIIAIKAWRTAENGERFAVVEQITATSTPIAVNTPSSLEAVSIRSWVLPAIFQREQSGHGAFLTELRPATALFLRFTGIEYDDDQRAGEKLSAFIYCAQNILTRYEGVLLQLTIGDKGSYLYAGFGAPTAHEDDARRSVQAALDLLKIPHELQFLQSIQIGISSGMMRTGAYGGSTRRTYGALGDEVNVAARLMSAAGLGEILVSGQVQNEVAGLFSFGPGLFLPLKGKAELLPAFAVMGRYHKRAIRLEEPQYALPIIGRQAELALINEKLELALQGKGQVIGLTAEAGMGKSRLVAEVIRLARQRGFTGYGGACESSGTNTPYLVWKAIWQAFFAVDHTASLGQQIRLVESVIESRAPLRLSAIPVLSVLLDIPIEDNDFTRALEPKDRRNLLTTLLEDCLKSVVAEQPVEGLLIVLEDLHWIDSLSNDLLETLARVSVNLPVCFVLAYRPPATVSLRDTTPQVESLSHFTRITINQLTNVEAGQLIRAKLAQLFSAQLTHTGAPPQALVSELTARAEGNPFYIEELLNYLRDRGINPYDEDGLRSLELPSSLHALILSRMDRLSDTQNVTIKTASIIGRLFNLTWLHGYYPALGDINRIKADLADLAQLDLTPLETPEPELTYLFKHIITHEVAYESLDYATRAHLHEQLAQFIETLGVDRHLDLLAFHYTHSTNTEKQREYLQKAGEAAQAAFANQAALDYFAHLLPLLKDPYARMELHLKRGAVLELLGKWPEAETEYGAALVIGNQVAQAASTARVQRALGTLFRMRGDYPSAQTWLEQARETFTSVDDQAGLALTLIEMGILLQRQGDYPGARQVLERALTLARALADQAVTAKTLNHLGIVAYNQGDNISARALCEQSLALKREMDDKRGIAASLNLLGIIAWSQADYPAARMFHEEGLALFREMGDKWGTSSSLNNLGLVFLDQGDIVTARALNEESLALFREMGDKWGITLGLINLGNLLIEQGDATAQARYAESLVLCKELGDKKNMVNGLSGLGAVAALRADMPRAIKLAAAAETLRLGIGAVWEATEGRIYEHTIAAARAGLGEDAFMAAWAQAAHMTLDQAINYALADSAS